MSTFVGEQRHEIVRGLLRRFDESRALGRPHLVSIEGEAGWGKTRLVHEFYSRLQAERQPDGEYWPPSLGGTDRDPMTDRKVVYPQEVRPPADLDLPWLWWGLRCDLDSGGRPVRALMNDRIQLHAHLDALKRRASRKAKNRELATSVLSEMVTFIPVVGQVATVATAAAEIMPKLAEQGADIAARRRARREAGSRSAPRVIPTHTPDIDVQVEVDLVNQFISPELPLVLVVDDAHEADGGTVRFLRRLMGLPVPSLVVTTAWPSKLDDEDALEDESFAALLDDLDESSVSRVALDPLSPRALETLVREVAPRSTDEQVRTMIAVSDGNPLVLRLQLSSRRVQNSIVDGAITLTPAQLERLPNDYEGLVRDRYRNLGSDQQRWLAQAALQGFDFAPDYLQGLASVDEEELRAFVRISEVGDFRVGRFTERPVHQAILSVSSPDSDDAAYDESERRRWETGTLAMLLGDWSGPAAEPAEPGRELPADPALRRVVSRLLVRLAEEHRGAVGDPATVVDAATRWSFAARDLDLHEEELQAARIAWEWTERDGSEAGAGSRAAARISSALRALNRRQEAVDWGRTAVELARAGEGVSADDLSTAHLMLSRALLQAGDVDGAREQARLSAETGDDEDTVYALMDLADADASIGEFESARIAIERAREVIAGLPRDDPLLAAHLVHHAAALQPHYGTSEHWLEAARQIERLVGAGHELHIACISSAILALAGGEGRLAEATRLMAEHDEEQYREALQVAHGIVMGFTTGDLTLMLQQPDDSYLTDDDEGLYHTAGALSYLTSGSLLSLPSEQRTTDEFTNWELGELIYILQRVGPVTVSEAIEARLARKPLTRDPDSRLFIVQTIAVTMFEAVCAMGGRPPRMPSLVDRLERVLGEGPDYPPVTRALVTACRRVLDAFAGDPDDAVPEPLRELGIFSGRFLAALAIAQHVSGQPGFARTLERGREVVQNVPHWVSWQLLARAHDRCGDHEHAPAVWSGAAELSTWEGQAISSQAAAIQSLAAAGRAEEAAAARSQTVARAMRLVGSVTIDRAADAIAAAAAMFMLDELELARDLERRVLDLMEAERGPDHWDTIEAASQLALTEHRLENYAAAAELKWRVLAHRERERGTEDPLTVKAMITLAATLSWLDDRQAELALRRRALEAQVALTGADDPAAIEAAGSLAETLTSLGEYEESERVREEQIERARRVLGPHHEDTLDAMASLAATRQHRQDWTGAAAMQRQVLDALEQSGGSDERRLQEMRNLWVSLWNGDQLEPAREVGELMLGLSERHLGPDDPETLVAVRRLASCRAALQDHVAARPLRERLVAWRRRELGERHPETLDAIGGLVDTLIALDDHDPALQLAEQALSAWTESRGEGAPETLSALMRAMRVQVAAGATGPAGERVARLTSAIAALGTESPDALIADALRLAARLFNAGALEPAREIEEQLLALVERRAGPTHPETLKVAESLAATHERRDDWEAALPLRRRVHEGARDRHGEDHPEAIFALARLAAALHRCGRYEEGRPLEEWLVAWSEQHNGPAGRQTFNAMTNLSATLGRLGDWAARRDLLRQRVDRDPSPPDSPSPDRLEAMMQLAGTHRQLGEYREGRDLAAEVAAARERNLGGTDPLTREAQDLAMVLAIAAGDDVRSDAAALLEQRLEVLGREHPATMRGRHLVVHALALAGEPAAAADLLQENVDVLRQFYDADDLPLVNLEAEIAVHLYRAGRLEEARAIEERVLRVREVELGPGDPLTRQARENLQKTLDAIARGAEA